MSQASLATKDDIVAAVRRLAPNEQVDVVLALQDVLPFGEGQGDSADDEFSDAQHAKLDRRIAAYRANPASAIDMDDFVAELDDRFGDKS